jgi:hypothetical protein
MIRFVYATASVLLLASAAGAEGIKGHELINLFSKTCLLKPALPSELDSIASKAGFANEGASISLELERGSALDVVYFAKLPPGKKAGISAYFTGPVENPSVSCTVKSLDVSTEGLEELVEESIDTRDRTIEATAKGGGLLVKWHLGAEGGGDMLELTSYKDPSRASITISYHARER